MSGLSALSGFTFTDAMAAVLSAGVGLTVMRAFSHRLIVAAGLQPDSWGAFFVSLLILSAGIWVGNILSRAILGR
jgi:hypothetical protein